MNLFQILRSKSKFFFIFLVLLAGVNSLLFSGLLIFINNTIAQKPLPFFQGSEWLAFLLLLLFSIVINRIFQTYMIRLTSNILYDFEISILQRVRLASFQDYSKFGAQKIYTAIADTRMLSALPESFINCVNSMVLIICGLAYLFYISIIGGVAILILMLLLLAYYLLRNNNIEKEMNKVRDLQDSYHSYLRDMLLGFKEIKLSSLRNNNLYNNFLKKNREASRDIGISNSKKYLDNELVGKYSWYVVQGVILFVFPIYFNFSIGEISAFVLTILYLMGPVATLIMVFPTYTRIKIATERINALNEEIKSEVKEEEKLFENSENERFESVVFENITFLYEGQDENSSFKLGPLNLSIKTGEIIFITGGNGSGKSTFINILTGLYRPVSGKVLINGQVIEYQDYTKFRDQISAIFTDNFLFSENYDGFDLSRSNSFLNECIQTLKLEEKISFNDEKNTIDISLSKGQQKRLAMIYAIMERRQIMVLDEWAAEQDPEFRYYFYKTMLPLLKGYGKTIVAVTHDDKYFDCADRIIKFDYGQIGSIKKKVTDDLQYMN